MESPIAATRGRLCCNTVCPVGTLLGLIARISWLRITFEQDGCKGCKLCEDVCKAGCTACHLCVSACPSRVLVPSLFEFGLEGIMQLRMYDPHGGLSERGHFAVGRGTEKLTQLGVAKFIKENCVVFTDNTACGACSEHCPTKAVDMVPYVNPDARW